MKKQLLFALSLMVAVVFSSCKNLSDLDPSLFTSTPNPLETKAGKVEATVTGTFPVKYFTKNAIVTVTPVMKLSNGQTVKAAPSVFQGEKVVGNDKVISYKAGGSYSMNVSFDYVPEMAVSELFLEFDVVSKSKSYKLTPVKVADGVIATSELAQKTFDKSTGAVLIKDQFERDIMQMTEADILFLIQQSTVRSAEVKSDDIKALTARVLEARDAMNQSVESLQISAYASPDGATDLNTTLAERRQKETEKFLNAELKKIKSPLTVESRFTPEDWDGFQALMEKSNIQDKELILRVLSMYSDPEQREREIKNLSAAFQQIATDVLPQLRRSQLKLMVKVTGKSDEEIATLAKNDPSALNIEELLYAATLTSDAGAKQAIYKKVTELYPNDVRAYNNMGQVCYYMGNLDNAEKAFAKALSMEPRNPDANYNAGLIALAKGQMDKAEAYFGNAVGTTGNLKNALGTYYMAAGDYAKAKSTMLGVSTNNTALLQILNKEYNAAKNTLGAIETPDATTSYLKAVVAARTNDKDGVYSNLKSAVAMNKEFAVKALKDLEFAKYWADSAFRAI
ncbi:MAG: tetratricopeptide repeat protein, partial [Paludibacter sp.]|nr:tetratricopeptide repeat protein [Paludibacter sp.]